MIHVLQRVESIYMRYKQGFLYFLIIFNSLLLQWSYIDEGSAFIKQNEFKVKTYIYNVSILLSINCFSKE